ncbi:MAG: hypothetical protein NTZ97_04655 [Candidatus Moranbacteria bacterium]|nr:hypothetical protein [Candidatus Moranbacteria bacterium]
MHQTFYIDIDEEITSIVDRLRKARANEVIIVVPKRALLIQSIVNLRLLKKEAEKHNKELVIVTQDKLGKLVVEKAGIAVQQRLDEVDGEEIIYEGEEIPAELLSYDFPGSAQKENSRQLEEIGSTDFFDANKLKSAPPETVKLRSVIGRVENEKILNRELVTEVATKKRKSSSRKLAAMDIVRGSGGRKKEMPANWEDYPQEKKAAKRKKSLFNREMINREDEEERIAAENFSDEREEKLHDFFLGTRQAENLYDNSSKKEHLKINLSGKVWKFFFIFVITAVVLGGGFFAYLFLPKAEIKISIKPKLQEASLEVKGSTAQNSVDTEAGIIPMKTLNVDVNLSQEYPTSGSLSGTNQKSRGTITIYNEYSSNPQPLVATTRFASKDGKIFRLAKGVTVPGTTKVGEEIKPGAIEAEVVADQVGAEYNIEPTTFTIPGFQGSGNEKYAKFYAKSFKAMAGGGSGKDSVNKAVSKEDIANAKSKALAELQQVAKQKAKESIQTGEKVIEESISVGEATYKLSSAEGEMADKISVNASATATVLVISENDVKALLAKEIAKKTGEQIGVNNNATTLQFGKAEVDLAKGSMAVRVDAVVSLKTSFDTENLKRGILGKNEEDFKAYLKTFPEIEGAEINYWPPFIGGRIPAYEQRVSVTLDNNN